MITKPKSKEVTGVMSLLFKRKITFYLFSFYLILQVLICYTFGGWLIANLFEIDGYYGLGKYFFIITDISILFAALISLTALAISSLRLTARILTMFNMLSYIGIMIYDFIDPPPTIKELMLYTLCSSMIIITYFWYRYLVGEVSLKRYKSISA